MKNKFATIIMSIIIILIIGIISIFGIILWEEIQQTETSIEPESFKTVFSENSNTVNKNIETPAVKENVFDDIKDSNQNTSVDYSNIKVDKYFFQSDFLLTQYCEHNRPRNGVVLSIHLALMPARYDPRRSK